jgi:PAS domain S-box-containing protein
VIPGISESNPELLDIYSRVALTGTPERFETYVALLGTWLSVSVFSPEKEYFIAVFDNITERKKAEESLNLFRTLIDRSRDMIEVVDPKTGRFLDINETACRELGYTREELLALNVPDVDPMIDHAAFTTAAEGLRESGIMLIEGLHRRKDGSTFPVEVNISHVQLEREYAVAVVRDISERIRGEAALRLQSAALNAAANPMFVTNRNGTIEWANKAFSNSSGFSAAEAIGKNPRELLKSGVHDASFYKGLWDTIVAGEVWRGEMVNRRKDGSLHPVEETITPVKNTRGEITHFIAIKRDLTEEKALQAQFLHAQKLESVGRLAGGIAHDFNNLLTVILGTTELASMQLREGDPLRAELLHIEQAGGRAASLTRQLLAFSRKQVMKPQVVNLNTLLADLRSMLQRLIGEDIDLAVVLARDLGSVKVDPGQVEQLVLNLAVNARDAMPTGGTLTLETKDVEFDAAYAAMNAPMRPGPNVMLAVSDTGVGMEEATLNEIFEPFFTTKEPGKGTGLGLSTVYGIVTQSGGSISVQSELGKGTAFQIYFPRVEEVAHKAPSAPRVKAERGVETILIVDDEQSVRHLTKHLLEFSGYKVLMAANGGEALEVLERHAGPVHLVLTDVVMPGITGPELVERLAHIRPSLKVLYTSGYADDAILRHGVFDEGTQFIAKPYTVTTLTRKVREVLDSSSSVPTTG